MSTTTLIFSLVALTLGVVALLFGHRVHRAFAALGGFLAGLTLVTETLANWNPFATLLLAVVAGVAMGALAMIAMRPIAALASFFGIGFLVFVLCGIFNMGNPWLFFFPVIAGAIAAVAMYLWFEWAFIVNTSLAGAGAIVGALAALLPALTAGGGWLTTVLAAVLATIGVFFQARDHRAKHSDAHAGHGTVRNAG
ncbi:MAG TPA: hypothetical protein PKD53_07155 [Chloroflexaceae bacterium]|nr:hypothetical protein [Chloroflexaceae bacterium]